MLNFYGLILVDFETGEVARHPHCWEKRYKNLRLHGHNNLRISTLSSSPYS